jgi:hypothetical protein
VLCWILQLTSPSPDYGYQGTFAVDAQTGALVSGWAQNLYPNTLEEYVSGAVDFSHVEGFSVASETFLVNGSVLGMPGSVPVVVPDVVVLGPGSSGSIGFNFSSTLQTDASESLSFENPLPGIQTLASNGLPQGVNVTFSGQPFTVPNNGSAESTISIAVASDAPSGTFLMELTASQSGTQVGESGVLFLMTVWNGTGTWPLPPTVA